MCLGGILVGVAILYKLFSKKETLQKEQYQQGGMGKEEIIILKESCQKDHVGGGHDEKMENRREIQGKEKRVGGLPTCSSQRGTYSPGKKGNMAS